MYVLLNVKCYLNKFMSTSLPFIANIKFSSYLHDNHHHDEERKGMFVISALKIHPRPAPLEKAPPRTSLFSKTYPRKATIRKGLASQPY